MYCPKCGKFLDERLHVCPHCLNLLTGWVGGGTLTSSGATGSVGGEFHIADALDTANATISKLESSYSGSKTQIETLRAMGVEEKVLLNLSENVEIMKAEADRQRNEFQQTLRNKAWTSVEELAKRSEQKYIREFLASKVIEEAESCNLLSRRGLSGDFFNLNSTIVNAIHKECPDADAFHIKIGALAQMFEIDLTGLRSKVTNAETNWKSVRLLEEWVNEKRLQHDPDMFKVWKAIIDFRNASFPYHETGDRVVELTTLFGHKYPPDYSELWMDVLKRFLKSTGSFCDLLSRAIKGSS